MISNLPTPPPQPPTPTNPTTPYPKKKPTKQSPSKQVEPPQNALSAPVLTQEPCPFKCGVAAHSQFIHTPTGGRSLLGTRPSTSCVCAEFTPHRERNADTRCGWASEGMDGRGNNRFSLPPPQPPHLSHKALPPPLCICILFMPSLFHCYSRCCHIGRYHF